MRFTSLSSGSEGNALVIESAGQASTGPARVLVDCGLALKEVTARLEQRGLLLSDLDAIYVTHEHSDHVSGVARLARAASIPVFLTHGTRVACPDHFWRGIRLVEVDSHAAWQILDLHLQVFPVPHDAREPAQIVISDGQHRLGILTDTGKSTPHIEAQLSLCDALFLEANHDEERLEQSDYPAALKARISGPFGHLSNRAAAGILAALDQSRLQVLVAAHLSQNNNAPELVQSAFSGVVSGQASFQIASQDKGFDWISLSR